MISQEYMNTILSFVFFNTVLSSLVISLITAWENRKEIITKEVLRNFEIVEDKEQKKK